MLWVVNLICVAMSWFPFYPSGTATDAKAMLLLAGSGMEGDRLAAMLYVLAQDAQGVRPRDWDRDSVEPLRAPGDSPLAATASILMLTYVFDTGGPDEIVAATESVLESSPRATANLRRVAFDNVAFVQGLYRRNPALASAWLEDARRVKGALSEKDWDAGALGAVALAEGRTEQAREHFVRAIARPERHPGRSGSVAAWRERLALLLEEEEEEKPRRN